MDRGGREPMSPDIALNKFKQMADNHNMWEQIRVSKFAPKTNKEVQWESV
jgi:hypothetical protein